MQVRRTVRPLTLLLVLGGIVAALVASRRVRASSSPGAVTDGPAWPPLDPAPTPSRAVSPTVAESAHTGAHLGPQLDGPGGAGGAAAAADPASDGAAWVAPVEGACPVTHPIKANDRSGIYHQPGGRFYERTTPERCYADAAAAEADGYRAAKGS